MPKYEVTFRVHDGWKYNEPFSYYTPLYRVIEAKNKAEAFEKAQCEADEDNKEIVTVCKKDVVRLPAQPKMTYKVTLEFIYRTTVEVKAEDPADAKNAVREMPLEKIFGRKSLVPCNDLEDGQPIAVYDKDWNQVG